MSRVAVITFVLSGALIKFALPDISSSLIKISECYAIAGNRAVYIDIGQVVYFEHYAVPGLQGRSLAGGQGSYHGSASHNDKAGVIGLGGDDNYLAGR